MKLGTISKHPHSGFFLIRESGQADHIGSNNKLVSTTNLDVSLLDNSRYSELVSLGEAFCELALKTALSKLTEIKQSSAAALESFEEKFEMCHRGLVPIFVSLNGGDSISVLSFSDEDPELFCVTRFFKIGDDFQHSFEMQDVSIHQAFPCFFQAF